MNHNKINAASSFLPAPESWPGVFLDPVLGLGVVVAVVVSVVGGVVREVLSEVVSEVLSRLLSEKLSEKLSETFYLYLKL